MQPPAFTVPILNSRVSRSNDEDYVIALEVSTSNFENIANIAADIPGHLDIELPYSDMDLSFSLNGVNLEFVDESGDGNQQRSILTPDNRDLNLVSY